MMDLTVEDIETPLSRVPADSKPELRLWLRMLACTNLMEAELRRRLRQEFDVTLPQFDVMAQLHREPKGLRHSELSRRLMVTKGNITGLIDTLVEAGFVLREAVPGDRRALNVRLTKAGAALFRQMATRHEAWVIELLSDVPGSAITALVGDLDAVKQSVRKVSAR